MEFTNVWVIYLHNIFLGIHDCDELIHSQYYGQNIGYVRELISDCEVTGTFLTFSLQLKCKRNRKQKIHEYNSL